MGYSDLSGYPLTGASSEALPLFEHATRCFQSWRDDPLSSVDGAIDLAPGFVMARILRGYILICGRERGNLHKVIDTLPMIAVNARNDRERIHARILHALCGMQYDRGNDLLTAWLAQHPLDSLALQVAHGIDHLHGNTLQLRDRIASVWPRWRKSMPGFECVASMYAFGLAENHDHAHAFERGLDALAVAPGNPRAHHALVHVYETTNAHSSGLVWMEQHRDEWDGRATVATHLWWHEALFHLQIGDAVSAFELFDAIIASRASATGTIADLIDASSLLWRLHLAVLDLGTRAAALTELWEPHLKDGFYSINDVHAVMTLVLADRWDAIALLMKTLMRRSGDGDHYARTTQAAGLPACLGIVDFARGETKRAIQRLENALEFAHLLGGSGAQRSILALTLTVARRQVMRKARNCIPRVVRIELQMLQHSH